MLRPGFVTRTFGVEFVVPLPFALISLLPPFGTFHACFSCQHLHDRSSRARSRCSRTTCCRATPWPRRPSASTSAPRRRPSRTTGPPPPTQPTGPPPPPHLHKCGNANHNVCAHSVYRGPARKKMLKDNWGSVELYDTLRSIAIKDDCGGTCPQ